MQLNLLVSLLSVFAACSALQYSNGKIETNGISQDFGSIIEINSVSTQIKISLELAEKDPKQLFFTFVNENGVEKSYQPTVSTTTASLTVNYSELPKLFKTSPNLKLRLIGAGSISDSDKINTEIAEFYINDKIVDQSYTKAERIEPKAEIFHVFSTPEKTVPFVVAAAFAAQPVVCFLGLLTVWSSKKLVNVANFSLVNDSLFVVLVLSYELVFWKYYTGSTIFETLWRSAILAGPTLWFGASSLRRVRSLREIGK